MSSRDREAFFDTVYEAHRRTLHAYVLGRCGDRELALDLLQDVFLRAWRSLGSLQELPAERHAYWLFSVARNVVIDHYRASGARETAHHKLEQVTPPAAADAAEAEAVDADQVRRLDAAIKRLPDELRDVLVLHVLGGRTSAEIGELLARPPGTVRYQLAHARRRLAADLELSEEEPSV
jgi:RNA polymerase sigma-70 factor (ECF subfamily)